jgi:hypothetical protein
MIRHRGFRRYPQPIGQDIEILDAAAAAECADLRLLAVLALGCDLAPFRVQPHHLAEVIEELLAEIELPIAGPIVGGLERGDRGENDACGPAALPLERRLIGAQVDIDRPHQRGCGQQSNRQEESGGGTSGQPSHVHLQGAQIRPAYGSRQQANWFDAAACMNASARPND